MANILRMFMQQLGDRLDQEAEARTRAASRPLPPAPVDEPVEDPLLGDPVAHAVKRSMEAGDTGELGSLIVGTPDPDDRYFYVENLADTESGHWASQWLKRAPQSATANLMAGSLVIHQAWKIRGSGYAKSVKPEAWEKFWSHLELGETVLKHAARTDPKDASAWVLLMKTSVGLQHEPEVTAERFAEAVKRAPQHRTAHSRMLQQFCKKWSGSHEKMFEFARSSSAKATPGSGVHTLIPEAHFEWWLDDDNTKDYGRRPDPYFSSREVRDELIAAAQRCFDPEACEPGIDSVRSRNYFAAAFWLAGELELARAQLAATGNWVTQFPWCYTGAPVKVFNQAREACGMAAGAGMRKVA